MLEEKNLVLHKGKRGLNKVQRENQSGEKERLSGNGGVTSSLGFSGLRSGLSGNPSGLVFRFSEGPTFALS